MNLFTNFSASETSLTGDQYLSLLRCSLFSLQQVSGQLYTAASTEF